MTCGVPAGSRMCAAADCNIATSTTTTKCMVGDYTCNTGSVVRACTVADGCVAAPATTAILCTVGAMTC